MTLCTRDNTEVTHILKNGILEVTFEQACTNGFKTLVLNQKGEIISNDKFNASEVQFFKEFMFKNLGVMLEEAKGVLQMPKILVIEGYQISIWSNENDEPIHVHISKKEDLS